MSRNRWSRIEREIVNCERCPRLIEHCREVARVRRKAFRDETYWGKPVLGFGDRSARILVLGLAPGAHGANRTGRMFTGDRSGEWLYAALHRAGLASRPESVRRDDDLELHDAFISAVCRCAPPQNRPTAEEMRQCASFLDREFELLPRLTSVLALGGVAWDALHRRAARVASERQPRPRPRFGHAKTIRLSLLPQRDLWVVGSYHPSQQNTLTGRLTRSMLDDAIRRAVATTERG